MMKTNVGRYKTFEGEKSLKDYGSKIQAEMEEWIKVNLEHLGKRDRRKYSKLFTSSKMVAN